jgi:O-antigen/teichoic acid export membrane protein
MDRNLLPNGSTALKEIWRTMKTWLSNRMLWSGVDAAAGPCFGILLTAGLIRALGPEQFGVLVVVQAFSVLSLALNQAVVATTMRSIAAANADATRTGGIQLALTLGVASVTAFGVVLATFVLIFAESISGLLFGMHADAWEDTRKAAIVLSFALVAVQQLDAVFSAGLKGLEYFAIQGLYEVSSKAAVAGSAVLTGIVTKDLIFVVGVQLLGTAFSAFGRVLVLRRKVPGNAIFRNIRFAEVLPVLGFGGWMLLNAAATSALGTVDRIVVTRMLGSVASAEYAVYSQVLQFIQYVPASVLAFSFPVLSRLISTGGDMQAARQVYRKVFRASILLGVVVGALLVFGGAFALGAITGIHPARLPSAYLVLAATYTLLTIAVAPYYLLLAAGQSRAVSLITLGSISVTLLALVPLVHRYGLVGASISRMLYAVCVLALVVLAHIWWQNSSGESESVRGT